MNIFEAHMFMQSITLLACARLIQVRGLVLSSSKLVITTALFVMLVFVSENRSLATGMCGVFLTVAAVCTLQASSSGKGDGHGDEESVELAQNR